MFFNLFFITLTNIEKYFFKFFFLKKTTLLQPSLKNVKINACKSLEEVFELGEVDKESNEECRWRGPTKLLSSLTTLELDGLPKLKC